MEGFPYAGAIQTKPKQTLQNNDICLHDDGEKRRGGGVNLSQKDSYSACPLSGTHRRNNYSLAGQTAVSGRQSSILGWQKIRSKRAINHVACFLFSCPISSSPVFLWPASGLRIWQQCSTFAVASHRQSVSSVTLWWA